jgi:DNA-binding MarR family transcriptional regulator
VVASRDVAGNARARPEATAANHWREYNSACTMASVPPGRDPMLGTLLRHLIDLLDGAVEQAYAESGLDYRPRFTPVMRALIEGGPLTIRAIAQRAWITHSAASQTVVQMEQRGLVVRTTGVDARERIVTLTARAIAIVPSLQQHWAATTAAVRELEDELSAPLGRVLGETIAALDRVPFGQRIAAARRTEGGRTTTRAGKR